jgi:hypothetical protein
MSIGVFRSTRQHAALRTERQVAQFVQDDEIGMDKARSDLSESALHLPQLERIDQFDCREAADASEMVERPAGFSTLRSRKAAA